MARRFCLGLSLATFLGITFGCGKEQPQPPKGMNPFNKMEGQSPKEKAKPKNPMIPN